ncbi:MAG: Cna B-type domain-containing protein [Clostridia bacterium]|nr:Cna B-type domain-containing protein [Clostridia bacterium]
MKDFGDGIEAVSKTVNENAYNDALSSAKEIISVTTDSFSMWEIEITNHEYSEEEKKAALDINMFAEEEPVIVEGSFNLLWYVESNDNEENIKLDTLLYPAVSDIDDLKAVYNYSDYFNLFDSEGNKLDNVVFYRKSDSFPTQIECDGGDVWPFTVEVRITLPAGSVPADSYSVKETSKLYVGYEDIKNEDIGDNEGNIDTVINGAVGPTGSVELKNENGRLVASSHFVNRKSEQQEEDTTIYEYKIEGKNDISLDAIISALQADYDFPNDFKIFSVVPENDKLTVNKSGNDYIVEVKPGLGNRDALLSVIDDKGIKYNIYVYSDRAAVNSYYSSAAFTVSWNDNKGSDPNSKVSRPLPEEEYINDNYTFLVTVGEKDYTLTEFTDWLDEIGVSSDYFTDFNLFDKLQNAKDEDTAFNWVFNFGWNNLPYKIAKEGSVYSISYKLVQEELFDADSAKNYISEDVNGIPADVVEINSRIVNTAVTAYKSELEWKDYNNNYGTRPDGISIDDISLNVTNSKNHSKKPISEDVKNSSVIMETDPDTGSITFSLKNLPAFDSDGNALFYSLKIDDSKIVPKEESTPGDRYKPTYKNEGNYASNTEELYHNGTLTELLSNTIAFTYTVEWKDQNSTTRPDANFYLYLKAEDIIISEDQRGGFDPITSSAVNGYKVETVSKENTADKEGEKVEILVSNLHLYDADGRRLIYFGYVRDAGKNYITTVDNTNTIYTEDNNYSAEIKDIFDELKAPERTTPKYILNGGHIINTLSTTTKATLTKKMNAAVLAGSNNIQVDVVLQRLEKNGDSYSWVNVKYGDLLKEYKEEDNVDLDADVVKNLTSFRVENNMTVTLESELLPRYDADGNEYSYRWQELSVSVYGNKTDIDWNSDSPDYENLPSKSLTDSTVNETEIGTALGPYAPGVGNTKVDFYHSAESRTEYSAENGAWNTEISDTIKSPTFITVTKTWWDKGNITELIGSDYNASITCGLYRDGVKIEDLTLNGDNFDENLGKWVLDLDELERFDEQGKEYVYTIKEINIDDGSYDANGWHIDTDYVYSVVEIGDEDNKSTAKKLTVNITNSTGGEGGTEIYAEKRWLDDGDSSSRLPSYMAVFNTAQTYTDGETKKPYLLGVIELNEKNGWYEKFGIGKNSKQYFYNSEAGEWQEAMNGEESLLVGDISTGNFVAVEIGIGATGHGGINGFTSTATMHYYGGKTFTEWSVSEVNELTSGAGKGGTIADNTNDADGASQYTYKVSGTKEKSNLSGKTSYVWTNLRTATLNIVVNKTWADADEFRAGVFEVVTGDKPETQTTVTKFRLGNIDGKVESGKISEDDTAISYEIKEVMPAAKPGKPAPTEPVTVYTATISDLPKFDDEGAVITYSVKETGIAVNSGIIGFKKYEQDEPEKAMVPYIVGNNTYSIPYYSTIELDKDKGQDKNGTVYSKLHHDGDITYYNAVNEVKGEYDLDFKKVWYVESKTVNTRPNVYYKIYRASSEIEVNGIKIYDYITGNKPGASGNYFSTENFAKLLSNYLDDPRYEDQIKQVQTISADRLYSSINKWVTDINVGIVDQYDEKGYPYFYFATEEGIGSQSPFYGNIFYGNMSSAELNVNVNGTSAQECYDINSDAGDNETYYDVYKDYNRLVLSDGVHTPEDSNNPGEYYSRTVVNRIKDKRTISGSKLWKNNLGWEIPDVEYPVLTLELYRTTKTYEAPADREPNNLDLRDFLNQENAEKVTDIVLNCGHSTTSTNPTTGAVTQVECSELNHFPSYSFTVTKDSNGELPCFDEFGVEYNYYIIEKIEGNESGQVEGYPFENAIVSPAYFRVDNNYVSPSEYVEIPVTKNWVIDKWAQDLYTVQDLAPATVTLWAEFLVEDEEGDIVINGNNYSVMENAEAIEIESHTFDPKDITSGNTQKYTFSTYEKSEDNKIPLYGPNGLPMHFYITESSVSGYTKDFSVEDIVLVVNDEESDDTVKVYSPDKDIEITNTYTGKYTDGSFGKFIGYKVWDDSYVNNDSLRPKNLSLYFGRKVGTKVDADFTRKCEITVNENGKAEKADTDSTWTLSTSGANTWVAEIKDLPVYDTQGRQYTYFLEKESYTDENGTENFASAVGDEIGKYALESINSTTIKNKLSSYTSLTLKKNWRYEYVESVDESGNPTKVTKVKIGTYGAFDQLRRMNVLPKSVKYVVERKATDSDVWEPVDGSNSGSAYTVDITVNGTKKSVLGYNVDLEKMTQENFFRDFNISGVKWEPLPDIYQYRIVEYATWPVLDSETVDSEEEVFEQGEGDTSTIEGTHAMTVSFTKTVKQDSSETAVTLDNVLTTKKVRLAKVWVDNMGSDNTRPDKITLRVTFKNDNKTKEYVLYTDEESISELQRNDRYALKTDEKTGEKKSYFYTEPFYLPGCYSILNIIEVKEYYGEADGKELSVGDADSPYNYKQTVSQDEPTMDSSGCYTLEVVNTLQSDRKTISLTANKEWSDYNAFGEVTRPSLKFKLQYFDYTGKKNVDDDSAWIDITEDNLSAFTATTQDAVRDVPKTDSSETTWNNMFMYWDNITVDGKPQRIEYRVVEYDPNADKSEYSYKVYCGEGTEGDTVRFAYEGENNSSENSFTNELQTVKLNITKVWKASKKADELENISDSVLQSLIYTKAIPEKLKFTVQYQDNNGTWNPVILSRTSTGENGSEVETYAEFTFKVTDLFGDSGKNKDTGISLPVYDGNGNKINYRVVETGYLYYGAKADDSFISVNWQNDKADFGSVSTEPSAEFDMEPAKGKDSVTAVVTNVFNYTELTIRKTWLDESNRDGVRGDFTVKLKRDNGVYAEFTTSDGSITANSKKISNLSSVTKPKDNSSEWTISFTYLPKSCENGNCDYSWEEVNTTIAAKGYKAPVIDSADANHVTNIYVPERGSVSASKAWSDLSGWTDLTRPDETKPISVKLQWATNTNGPWTDVPKAVLDEHTFGDVTYQMYDDGLVHTTSDAVQQIKFENGAYTSVSWTDLPLKINTASDNNGNESKNVYYKVVETAPTGYTHSSTRINGTAVATKAGLAGTASAAQHELTNKLNTTKLKVTKNWTKNGTSTLLSKTDVENLIGLKAVPEYIRVKVQYSINGTDWLDLRDENGNPTETIRVLGMKNLIGGGETIDISLPRVTADGTKIQYRIFETEVKFFGETTYQAITWNDDGKGYLGSMSTAPATVSAADADSTSITLTNNYYFVDELTSITLTKKWEDEHNRDGKRGDFSIQLYRDDDGTYNDANKYGVPVSTQSSNGSISQWGTVTKGTGDEWTIVFDLLPKYQADATAHDEAHESKYTWLESDIPTGYTADHDKNNGNIVTNTYNPERGKVTVTKDWVDQNNDYKSRPGEIYVKLQWKDSTVANGAWSDVSQAELGANGNYPGSAAEPYTTSDVGWITLQKNGNNGGETHTWENLPKNIRVNGATHAVEYRAVEGIKASDSADITEIAPNGKLNGYTVTYASAKITGDDNAVKITNTLDTGSLKIKKAVSVNGVTVDKEIIDKLVSDYKVMPETLQVYLTCKRDGKDILSTSKKLTYDKSTKSYRTKSGESFVDFVFDKLPVKDGNGAEYTYEIFDVAPGYSYIECGSVSGIKVTNGKVTDTTITNSIEAGSVTVSKTWKDENDRDGGRTDVYVQLYRGSDPLGKVQKLAEKDGVLSYTWSDLPVYTEYPHDSSTPKYEYSVKECNVTVSDGNTTYSPVDNDGTFNGINNVDYTVSYSDGVTLTKGGTSPVTVTNTHFPKKGKIIAEKDWDNDNIENTHPGEAEFKLQYRLYDGENWVGEWTDITQVDLDADQNAYADGGVYTTSSPSVSLNGEEIPAWKATWENLPYNSNSGGTSRIVKYRIVETDITGYTVYYNESPLDNYSVVPNPSEGDGADNTTITVKNSLDMGKLRVTKVWSGDTAVERPGSITFQLKRDGEDAVTFSDLPVYTYGANGTVQKSVYSVEETEIAGYTTTYSANVTLDKYVTDTDIKGITVTNTLRTGNLSIDKVWRDESNREGKRATSITLQLYRDGVKYGEAKTLTAPANSQNVWRYTNLWTDLPLYKVGGSTVLSEYHVVETSSVDGYTTTYIAGIDSTTEHSTASDAKVTLAEGRYNAKTITVKNAHTVKSGAVSIRKYWNDNSGHYGLRPPTITFTLKWSVDNGKTWNDVLHNYSPDSFNDGGVYTTSDNPCILAVIKVPDKPEDNYNYAEWNDLRAYYEGKEILYKVEETQVPGYNLPEYTDSTYENVITNGNQAKIGDSTVNLYVKNTVSSEALTISKKWVGDENCKNNVRPVEITYLVQYKSDSTELKTLTSADGKVENGYITQTPNDKGEWADLSISGIPIRDTENKPYKYFVSEYSVKYSDGTVRKPVGEKLDLIFSDWSADIGEYQAKSTFINDGGVKKFSVVNTLPVGNISVTKVWNDSCNRDNLRKPVEVKLYRDDKLFDTKTISGPENNPNDVNEWSYTWNNLPVYRQDGTLDKNNNRVKSQYYVVETSVTGYETKYKVDVTDATETTSESDKVTLTQGNTQNIIITNTHDIELMSVTAKKVWDDSDNLYGMRPDSVQFKLQWKLEKDDVATTDIKETEWHDVTKVEAVPGSDTDLGKLVFTTSDVTQTLTNTTWQTTWSNLPAYYRQGEKISYRVVEVSVPNGYEISSESASANKDNQSKTLSIKNRLKETSLTVTKKFPNGTDYLENVKALPDSITVQLQYKNAKGNWVKVPENDIVTINGVRNETTEKVDYIYTFNNLNSSYEYRVIETAVNYGKASVEVKDGTAGNFNCEAETEYDTEKKLYNTALTNSLHTSKLTITKTWDDEDNRDILRKPLTINIYRDMPEGTEGDAKAAYHVASGKISAPGWSVSFDNLPVYKNGTEAKFGNESVYTVEEIQNEGYEDPKYIPNGVKLLYNENDKLYSVTVDIENIHNPAKGTLQVTKSWEDFSNAYGDRPENIYVSLMYKVEGYDTWNLVGKTELNSDGNYDDGKVYTTSDVTQQLTCTGENVGDSQTATWENLPISVNEDGDSLKVIYKAFETDADGKEIFGTESADNSTLSNYHIDYASEGNKFDNVIQISQEVTNTLDLTKLTVSKKWVGDESVYGIKGENTSDLVRPDAITFFVEYYGDDETWKPLTEAGENPICKDGYVTITAADNWKSATINNLPIFTPNDNYYRYRVSEAELHFGEKTVECAKGKFDDLTWTANADDIGGAGAYNAAVTTEYEPVSGTWFAKAENMVYTSALNIHTVWVDSQNRDGFRPENTEVELHMIDSINGEKSDKIIDTVIKNDSTEWKYEWNNLPVLTTDGSEKAQYYVVQREIAKHYGEQQYTTVYNAEELAVDAAVELDYQLITPFSMDEEETYDIEIVNRHDPVTFSLNGEKIWEDNSDFYGLRDKSVALTLEYSLDGGETWLRTIDENTAVSARPDPSADDGHPVYSASMNRQLISGASAENSWTGFAWNEIMAFALNEDGESCKILYRLVEAEDDISASYEMTESDSYEWNGYNTDEENFNVLKVTNELSKTVSCEVTKTWNLGNDIADINSVLPEYITVELQYENADGKWVKVPQNSTVNFSRNEETGEWKYVFENLRADLTYRAVEVSATWVTDGEEKTLYVRDENGKKTKAESGRLAGYEYTSDVTFDSEKSVYRTELVNTLDLTEFAVTKVWNDSDNLKNYRAPITVNLYRDGSEEIFATAVLTEENEWAYTFGSLPVYQNGSESKKSVYTVEEVQLEGYEEPEYSENNVSFDDKLTAKVEITNTLALATEITVTKLWEDEGYEQYRPEFITVILYADGVQYGYAKLSAENDWKYTFSDLPKFNNGQEIDYNLGDEIDYVIFESPSRNYVSVVDGFTITNYYLPPEQHTTFTDFYVMKVWDDNGDEAGVRPESVTVQLLRDGEPYGAPVELNDGNYWLYKWNLERYADPENFDGEYYYSVEEVNLPYQYEVSYDEDGYCSIITNVYDADRPEPTPTPEVTPTPESTPTPAPEVSPTPTATPMPDKSIVPTPTSTPVTGDTGNVGTWMIIMVIAVVGLGILFVVYRRRTKR